MTDAINSASSGGDCIIKSGSIANKKSSTVQIQNPIMCFMYCMLDDSDFYVGWQFNTNTNDHDVYAIRPELTSFTKTYLGTVKFSSTSVYVENGYSYEIGYIIFGKS